MSASTTGKSTSISNNRQHIPIPWSKQHKQVTKTASGGLRYSLSNSFAEPLTTKELIEWSFERGDQAIVHEYQNHSLEYTPNGGSWDLREAIAHLYDSNITAQNVLVFPGAQVALQTVHRTLCHSGMHAITFVPGYQSVVAGPAHCTSTGGTGCQLTQIPLRPENGWQIEIPKVEKAIQENTRYIVINEPYNPAGTLMSLDTQKQLIALAKEHNIHILCDEVYRWLEHDPNDQIPAMAEAYPKGISCVTLSKPWGACGITIGWIATQDMELMDLLTDWQYFGTACPSRASELQAIMCLRESDRILARNLKIIRHNKALLAQFISDNIDLFYWILPTAGAIAAIHFKGPLSSKELGDMLAADGIGMKPAYCFNEEKNITPETDYFRVGFGESIMPAALDALRAFVEKHKDEWRRIMKAQTETTAATTTS